MLQEPERLLLVPISLARKKKYYFFYNKEIRKLISFLNSNPKTMAVRFINLLSSIFALIEWIYCMEIFWKILICYPVNIIILGN